MDAHSRRDHFIRLFQRNRLRLFAYIRALTGDWNLAEDIFQEVSVVLLDKAETLSMEGDFDAWCRSVARNIAYRERTKSKRMKAVQDDMLQVIDNAFTEHGPPDALDADRETLRICMEKLSPRNIQILTLRYVSDLSLKELAAKLARSEGAVQVALSRLRKTVLECIQRRQGAPR